MVSARTIAKAVLVSLGLTSMAGAATLLPGGAVLVPRGLSDDGRSVLGLVRGGSDCWTLQSFEGQGSDWSKAGSVAGPGGACRPVTAARSATSAVVFDYGNDRALTIPSLDGTQQGQALVLQGEKAYSSPPPGGVAMSADGSAVLLGATNYECKIGFPQKRCGVAELFLRTGGSWTLAKSFAFPEGGPFNIEFGHAVAVGNGGEVVAAGGPGRGGNQGEVYLYTRAGDRFEQQGVLVPDNRDEASFGTDIALSADGRTLAVGSDQAVYLYTRTGDGWEAVDRVAAPEARAGYFGAALALSRDGSRLLVGAPRATCKSGQSRCGAGYLFQRSGSNWRLLRTLAATTPAPETDFGYAVALDGAGTTAAIQGSGIEIIALPAR